MEQQSNISSNYLSNYSQLNDGQVLIPNKPNITIKIEEDGNDISDSKKGNSSTSNIDENNTEQIEHDDSNLANQLADLGINDTQNRISPFQEDIEYLTDSPKQEHTSIKSRLKIFDKPDEIKIEGKSIYWSKFNFIDFGDERSDEYYVDKFSNNDNSSSEMNNRMSKELMSAIRENAKKQLEEDELEFFQQHQAIVDGTDVFKPISYQNQSESEAKSSDSKSQNLHKTKVKNSNNVYTVRKNKLSISIDDEKNLNISIEEEIDTKNISKDQEEYVFLSNQGNRLIEDENSIKGAIKEYESLLSDDLLTYSLTNTLKTVENLEGQLSDYKRMSSFKDKLNQSNKKFKTSSGSKKKHKTSSDHHNSFESSVKFSNLNSDNDPVCQK